jgi:hypothetical protein
MTEARSARRLLRHAQRHIPESAIYAIRATAYSSFIGKRNSEPNDDTPIHRSPGRTPS